MKRRDRHRGRPALMVIGLSLLVGCAPTRVPLPAVPPSELPDRWVSELAAGPCPIPFAARLQIRVETEGEPAVTLEGMLQAVPPDSIRLAAGVGTFRPAFVLLARADSCELLLHDGARYWITPRDEPDWHSMSPASWGDALTWAICPATFFRRFHPNGSGRVDQGRWTVAGSVDGIPWNAVACVQMADRSVTSLELSDDQGVLARITSSRISTEDGICLPERMEISRPREGTRLFISRRSVRGLSPEHFPSYRLLRPAGWTEAGPEGFDLRPEATP